MTEDPALRAGDADRDRVAEQLREHFAAGRLTQEGAQTAPARRSGREKALRAAWTAWTTAVSINVVIWVLVCLSARELIYFWPMWVAGPWGAVLIAATIAARSRD